MGYRLSKIYTRTGDKGTTSVGPKQRLKKNHIRIEVLGDLDELNSAIGLITVCKIPKNIRTLLLQIQNELFNLGGELCPPFPQLISAKKTLDLEKTLDELNSKLPPLKEFILPGASPAAAACHLARAICRRAERHIVALNEQEKVPAEILQYINRLSDLLFVIARVLGRQKSHHEKMWQHP